MIIQYDSNNSGGYWWLKDEDWKKLEKAGWKVNWYKDEKKDYPTQYTDGRWLGALAHDAEKDFPSIKEALDEFEKITGQDVSDEGCNCCGPPHCFSWKDEKGNYYYASGEDLLEYIFPNKKIPKSIRECLDK